MPSIKEAAAAFLADQRVAVSGVSRNPQGPRQQPRLPAAARTRPGSRRVGFHEPFRADDWPLYLQESPAASGARGLARGQRSSGVTAVSSPRSFKKA
jgi:hypothetical protein